MPNWRDAPLADFAVVGDPVDHSWSPKMHMAALGALGLSSTYLAIRIPRGELGEGLGHLGRLGYRGVNVTVPLKEEAFEAASNVDPPSRAYGAVNTIRLPALEATNTDAPAFMRTLQALGFAEPCTVLLLGAGGTARTVARALAADQFQVRIFNRTPERARSLAQEIGGAATVANSPAAKGCKLIVDATAAVLANESPAVDWSGVSSGALAYGVAYGRESRFLSEAAALGLRTVDGLEMLVEQGALALEWWLDVKAPRDVMREALRR